MGNSTIQSKMITGKTLIIEIKRLPLCGPYSIHIFLYRSKMFQKREKSMLDAAPKAAKLEVLLGQAE